MNLSKKSTKLVLAFARQWGLLFFLSALFSLSIALLLTDRWFNVLGRSYSLKTLFFTAPTVFVLIIWLVWPITRNFLTWIEPKTINFHWREYAALGIALIPLFAAVYYGWSNYGPKESLSSIHSNFEVEITGSGLNASAGEICLLEIKDRNGEKVQAETRSISGLTLTGDWTAETNHCLYFSPGSLPGSLKFSYAGPTDAVFHFLFRESKDAGPVLVRSNGIEVGEIELYSEQEGSKPLTAPMLLSRTDMLIWNTIGTAGWSAILVMLFMLLALLLGSTKFGSSVSSLIKLLDEHKWIQFVPVVIICLVMFWPPGAYVSPDVGYYLSLAKNLFHGNGYVNPDLSPNIYRGPVFPLLIALSYSFLGETFRSAVIMERVFWLLTIFISYCLGKQLFNRRVGFLASLFVLSASVINSAFYFVWTDGPLTFAILLVQWQVWETYRKQRSSSWYILLGVLMGAAYLLKQTAIFIVPLPLLSWLMFSEYRNRQIFKKLLTCYIVFAFFFFGWIGYVYSVGGSPKQVAGDLNTGLSIASRFTSILSTEQTLSTQTVKQHTYSVSLPQILVTYYNRDIARFFRIAPVILVGLAFTLFHAVVKKSKPDIYLGTGLLLFSSLIPIQVVANFGFRHNLYFFVIGMICIAAFIERLFSSLLSKKASFFVVPVVSACLIIIQISGGNYNFRTPIPIASQNTLSYYSDYHIAAEWIDKYVKPNEKILIDERDGNILHILTSGNRTFEIINNCRGETTFWPAKACSPPYISFWIYNGITEPDNPRDILNGLSEPSLISIMQDKDIKYIFVTPRIYSLYYYLSVHPGFEEATILGNFAIFHIKNPIEPIANYPNVDWNICLGEGTSEYLKNLKENNPARYEIKLRNEIEPWMGLSDKDLGNFMNWEGCQFPAEFPGEYRLPEPEK